MPSGLFLGSEARPVGLAQPRRQPGPHGLVVGRQLGGDLGQPLQLEFCLLVARDTRPVHVVSAPSARKAYSNGGDLGLQREQGTELPQEIGRIRVVTGRYRLNPALKRGVGAAKAWDRVACLGQVGDAVIQPVRRLEVVVVAVRQRRQVEEEADPDEGTRLGGLQFGEQSGQASQRPVLTAEARLRGRRLRLPAGSTFLAFRARTWSAGK